MAKLNLEEIGRLAGVPRSTVSRVVNGELNVSPEARARVAAVIAETGYRPHAAARSLASHRTGIVGLVIPSAVETIFDDPYFGRLILGVSRATNRMGTTLSLFLFNEESEEEAIARRVVTPGVVDGVMVTATQVGDPLIQNLAGSGMPFVVIGRPEESDGVFSIDVDNRGGARRAARHFAEMGRTRIGMIGAPSNTTAGIDRKAGFIEGLSDAGLDLGRRAAEGTWSEASGRQAMEEILRHEPDAVFAASDRMAIGALRAIRDAGLRCPEDVAVVSFDGIVNPDQSVPRLTSITQPVLETGERAATLLQDVIDGDLTRPEQIVLPVSLTVRESCGLQLAEAAS